MNEVICPTCKGQLNYIQEYNRWYCYKCAAYIDPTPQNQPVPQQVQQDQYRQQGYPQHQQSMVYIQGQEPYQQKTLQAGQGKACRQCGTLNELWSVTCKKCGGSLG